jgi:Polyketide cyclase / dehydrase and lipid transport
MFRKILKVLLVVLIVFVAWSALRAGTPVTAFRRGIVVNAPRQVAWDHFGRPREWKSWLEEGAPTAITPDDVVGPDTVATIQTGDTGITFRMAEFDPPNHWMWTAKILWFTILYDHIFERVTDQQTRIIFQMRVTGFGNDLFAALMGAASSGGHATALPKLAEEMNRLPAAQGR